MLHCLHHALMPLLPHPLPCCAARVQVGGGAGTHQASQRQGVCARPGVGPGAGRHGPELGFGCCGTSHAEMTFHLCCCTDWNE